MQEPNQLTALLSFTDIFALGKTRVPLADMPKIDAVLSVEDRSNLMNRAADAAKPAFATTFLDVERQPTDKLRKLSYEELEQWIIELDESIEMVRQLIGHLRNNDGDIQVIRTTHAFSAAQSAAKAAKILLHPCELISRYTKPVSKDHAFNGLVNTCLDKIQFIHGDACELAQS